MGDNATVPNNDRLMAEYKIDPTTGALTVVNGLLAAQNVATFSFRDPGHNNLYVLGGPKDPTPDYSSNVISGYNVDKNSGAIAPTPGSPYAFNPLLGWGTIRPDRKFAYVDDFTSGTLLHIISMDPNTGAMLQEVGTTTIMGSQNASVMPNATFDSTGHFLYVINAENNNVAAYASDPTTGALTAIPGSPFTPKGSVPTGCSPKANFCGGSLAISGNRLYYASELFNGIPVFNIDPATGALTEIPGSPFATNQSPYQAKTTPNGAFLYITEPADFGPNNLVLGFAINPATGALTPVPGSPYSVTAPDLFSDIDESGHFFYTSTGASIVGYSIDQATGALTLTPGSPYPVNGITGLTIVH